MGDTSIQWTGKTWNPIRARNRKTGKVGWFCEHVSEGCRNCYAERMNRNTYFGNGLDYKPQSLDQVELFLDEEILRQSLRWRKPTMVFPCSMTDIFGRFVKDEWIVKMFSVMAQSSQHTFQVLTKRAERMHEVSENIPGLIDWPNVWLGVSVENQKTAAERISILLDTRAAKHWVSAEPLLEPLHLCGIGGCCSYREYELDWMVIGGESGPNARPFHLEWARDIIAQLGEADIPVAPFVKQLGSNPVEDGMPINLKDKKGGNPSEWPEDLRVREFPKAA